MLYTYKATNQENKQFEGSIEAPSMDIAIASLQRRGLIIVSIKPAEETKPFWDKEIKLFSQIKQRDIVVFARQLSSLFTAKVPVLDSLRLLSSETENLLLRKRLADLADDIKGGLSMSQAMAKHPDVFSPFFVNMVRSGEESGKLDEIFAYLADYLERSYDLANKAKRALVYPAFVIFVFVAVMVLIFVFVMPRLGSLLGDLGKDVPFYTRVILGFSNFLNEFILYILLLAAAVVVVAWRYAKTEAGRYAISQLQLSFPYIGPVFKKIYLSRFADNLHTLLSGGVSMMKSLEITAEVVDNRIYSSILRDVAASVRSGGAISDALKQHEEIPSLVSQMVKIGEESGRLDFILKNLANFYRKEVDNAIETLISFIEPVMIVVLAVSVGFLMISVIGPIYQISAGI
jgi:type IV pilus assembly protein PilC